MIEVFKTNVNHAGAAKKIIGQIHKRFAHYRANFDLDDCDRILRVECPGGLVSASLLISILAENGFKAAILPDNFHVSLAFEHYYRQLEPFERELSKL